MKDCLTLVSGDVVQTLGYYSKNDGGEGLYEIVNDSSLEDNGGSVHELDNGLKAKLIIENDTINVKQFGAKGNGTTDDTSAIQKAINQYDKIFFSNGTYMTSNLTITSNKKVEGTKHSTIQAKNITISGTNNILRNFKFNGNNDTEGINIIDDNNTIDNLEIYNIKNIDGNLGRGIDCRNSNYIEIKNCYFHDLYSGNEEAEVGIDDGAVRAIRTWGCDYINIHDNKFEKMSGHKDGDYIHISAGGLGDIDNNFPYNGTRRYRFNEINVFNNTFIQKDCKSSLKIQCSNVNVYNNNFILDNETTSQYAIIRIQSGDYNNVTNNNIFIKNSSVRYNLIFVLHTCANCAIKNNVIDIEKTNEVVGTSNQSVFNVSNTKNIAIDNNNINFEDIRHVFYLDNNENMEITKNNLIGRYYAVKPTILRVLESTENSTSKSISFTNNYINENINDENSIISTYSFMQINTIENLIIERNIFNVNRSYQIFVFYNINGLYFYYNNINNKYNGEGVTYPISFYENCKNLECLNNITNRATAFYRMFNTIENFKFTSGMEFPNEVECCYNASGQDFTQYKYIDSNFKSHYYDYGYSPRPAKFENGHTFFERTSKKIYVYYDGKWYLDGVEHSF